MSNNRIYYASQVAQLRPCNAQGTNYANWYNPLGVQSVAMTTNFNREQAFQLGTVEIYDNVETVPEVEVTLNKVLDSTSPIYLMAMGGNTGIAGANGAGLVSLSNNRVHFRLGVYEDNKQYTEDTASSFVICTGMYLSSFNYTFPVDGNATEEITLVGNHKRWNYNYAGINSDSVDVGNVFTPGNKIGGVTPSASSGILRRQYFNIQASTLPLGSGGIGGPNNNKLPHLQNITISTNLGRESINQLGKFGPYCRYATFPIEVTSEFQVIAEDGDGLDMKDFSGESFCGTSKTNLFYKTINIVVCDADTSNNTTVLGFNLGSKNTLTSVNYAGGDTGGGNATVTYSFRNFNDFVINAGGNYAKAVTVADTGGAVNVQQVSYSNESVQHPITGGDNDNV